jgi:hypothetical protein
MGDDEECDDEGCKGEGVEDIEISLDCSVIYVEVR